MIRMTLKVPAPLRDWYRGIAKKIDRPIGELFREALIEKKERIEREQESQ